MARDALKGGEMAGNFLSSLQACLFAEVKTLTDANNGLRPNPQAIADEIKVTGMDEGLFEIINAGRSGIAEGTTAGDDVGPSAFVGIFRGFEFFFRVEAGFERGHA